MTSEIPDVPGTPGLSGARPPSGGAVTEAGGMVRRLEPAQALVSAPRC